MQIYVIFWDEWFSLGLTLWCFSRVRSVVSQSAGRAQGFPAPWAPAQNRSQVRVMVQLFPWQQSNGEWWGLFVYFLLHRAQGPCGCPIILSLSTGDEKSKHKSCIQNSCMLLSRIFFILVLDKFLFQLSQKVFLSCLTLSPWQCWTCTKFKEEKMHIQHY